MAKAGTLVVDLIAETQQFRADMQKAASDARTHSTAISSAVGDIKGAFDLVTTALGAFGIGLGAAQIVSFISDTIKSVAELKTLSQQVGLTTTEFQVFALQAQAVGVSQEEMTTAIRKMTDNIGLAAQGNKTALDTFNRLGVGILDSNNKIRSSGEIYRDITEALSRISDPAARAALEVQIFGRAGQELDPAMRGGKAAIDAATEAADRFNLAIGPAAIEKLDQFKHRMDLAKDSIHVMAAEAAAASVDVVDLLSKMALDAQKVLFLGPLSIAPGWKPPPGTLPPPRNELGRGGDLSVWTTPTPTHNPPATGSGDKAAAAAAALKKYIDNLKFEAEQLTRSSDEQQIANNLKTAGVSATSAAGQAIVKYTQQIQDEKAELLEIKKAGEDWDKEVAEGKALHEAQLTDQEKLNEAVARANVLLKDGLVTQQDVNRLAEDYNGMLQDAASLHDELATAEEKSNAELSRATELYNAGLLSAEDYRREQEKLKEGNKDLVDSINGIADAFASAATGATTWAQFMTAAIDIVAKELEKLLGVGANGSSSGSELANIFGGNAPGGSNPLGALFGSLFGGSSAGIGTTGPMAGLGGQGALLGFANGADFTVGGQGGVDRNVVAFRASRGERVRVGDAANDKSSGDLHVHQSFNISTPDANSFRKSGGQIMSEASRQVRRAAMRNGA